MHVVMDRRFPVISHSSPHAPHSPPSPSSIEAHKRQRLNLLHILFPSRPLLRRQARLALQLAIEGEVPRPPTEHSLVELYSNFRLEDEDRAHHIVDFLGDVLRRDDVVGRCIYNRCGDVGGRRMGEVGLVLDGDALGGGGGF